MSLSIGFLFVRPRFRYCFFSPTSHGVNLASRYLVRLKLRPLGLSPKLRDMPVIPKIRLCQNGRAGLLYRVRNTEINPVFPHYSSFCFLRFNDLFFNYFFKHGFYPSVNYAFHNMLGAESVNIPRNVS